MKGEILALEAKLLSADSSQEPDTSAILEELLASDVILTGPKGEIVQRSFVIDSHRPPKKQAFTRCELSEVEVREIGAETAVVSCVGHFEFNSRAFALRFLRTWSKSGGRWRVVAASVTFVS